jgi:Initiator Replication protein
MDELFPIDKAGRARNCDAPPTKLPTDLSQMARPEIPTKRGSPGNRIEQQEADTAGHESLPQANGELSGHITTSRALAESAHGLTLNEARVMMLAIRCLDSRKSPFRYAPDGYVRVRITADEFAQLAGLPGRDGRTATSAYTGLKSACDKLYERSASWREGKRVIKLRWVFKALYHDGEGWAEIGFSPDLTPHLFMLGRRFVSYRLEHARGLESKYSVNLLRLLMIQKDTGFKSILLSDFREVMEIPERYKYSNVVQKVIAVAIRELKMKADLTIEWRASKRGRSVYSLQFRFHFSKMGEFERRASRDVEGIQSCG